MKSSNAPFDEFGHSMVLRDVEDLFVKTEGLDSTVTGGLAGIDASLKTLSTRVTNLETTTSALQVSVATLSATVSGLGTMSSQNANAVAITGGSITGITDLAIADGGTGSSTAAGARSNLGLGSLATLSSLALSQLSDVTLTSTADKDFLRYDVGSTKWKNVGLGPVQYFSATNEFALDGGTTGAVTLVGCGKSGSRFILSNQIPLDFVISGAPGLGTDICVRYVADTANSLLALYDQAGGAGTPVKVWSYHSNATLGAFNYYDAGHNFYAAGTSVGTLTSGNQIWGKYFIVTGGDATVGASHGGVELGYSLYNSDPTGCTVYGENASGYSGKIGFAQGGYGLYMISSGDAWLQTTGTTKNVYVVATGFMQLSATGGVWLGPSSDLYTANSSIRLGSVGVGNAACTLAGSGTGATWSATNGSTINICCTDNTTINIGSNTVTASRINVSGDIRLPLTSTGKLGFFGNLAVSKQSVSAPIISSSGTAAGAYSSAQMQVAINDLVSIKAWIASLLTALSTNYGLL